MEVFVKDTLTHGSTFLALTTDPQHFGQNRSDTSILFELLVWRKEFTHDFDSVSVHQFMKEMVLDYTTTLRAKKVS